jgi:hypothetical protein
VEILCATEIPGFCFDESRPAFFRRHRAEKLRERSVVRDRTASSHTPLRGLLLRPAGGTARRLFVSAGIAAFVVNAADILGPGGLTLCIITFSLIFLCSRLQAEAPFCTCLLGCGKATSADCVVACSGPQWPVVGLRTRCSLSSFCHVTARTVRSRTRTTKKEAENRDTKRRSRPGRTDGGMA